MLQVAGLAFIFPSFPDRRVFFLSFRIAAGYGFTLRRLFSQLEALAFFSKVSRMGANAIVPFLRIFELEASPAIFSFPTPPIPLSG